MRKFLLHQLCMPNLALLNLLLQLVIVVIRTAIPCTSTCHALLISVLRICLDYLFAIDKFIIISLDPHLHHLFFHGINPDPRRTWMGITSLATVGLSAAIKLKFGKQIDTVNVRTRSGVRYQLCKVAKSHVVRCSYQSTGQFNPHTYHFTSVSMVALCCRNSIVPNVRLNPNGQKL
ncbi:hypothetical protein ABVK25_004685 [Lepraria finkii]|uniref:Secreted protein n=1 Tax=Lepraria finkii TaxID=1340010 RepID=A0ABR4BG22_9LECA